MGYAGIQGWCSRKCPWSGASASRHPCPAETCPGGDKHPPLYRCSIGASGAEPVHTWKGRVQPEEGGWLVTPGKVTGEKRHVPAAIHSLLGSDITAHFPGLSCHLTGQEVSNPAERDLCGTTTRAPATWCWDLGNVASAAISSSPARRDPRQQCAVTVCPSG